MSVTDTGLRIAAAALGRSIESAAGTLANALRDAAKIIAA